MKKKDVDKNSENDKLPVLDSDKWDKIGLNIQALLSLIPITGGFLSTYFGETRNNRIKQRMKEYFRYFSEKILELDQKKVDHEYLKSEEFAEFFLQGAEQATRSTTHRRIHRYANVLLNNSLLDAKARERTQSIIGLIDRISDVDTFILFAFGHPRVRSQFAHSQEECVLLVNKLANFMNVDPPRRQDILDSIIYMDNLGLMWVTQQETPKAKKDTNFSKEFSAFRSPLGDVVTEVIAPPNFYCEDPPDPDKAEWPDDYILYRSE